MIKYQKDIDCKYGCDEYYDHCSMHRLRGRDRQSPERRTLNRYFYHYKGSKNTELDA